MSTTSNRFRLDDRGGLRHTCAWLGQTRSPRALPPAPLVSGRASFHPSFRGTGPISPGALAGGRLFGGHHGHREFDVQARTRRGNPQPPRGDRGSSGLGTDAGVAQAGDQNRLKRAPENRGDKKYPDDEDPDEHRPHLAPREGRVEEAPRPCATHHLARSRAAAAAPVLRTRIGVVPVGAILNRDVPSAVGLAIAAPLKSFESAEDCVGCGKEQEQLGDAVAAQLRADIDAPRVHP